MQQVLQFLRAGRFAEAERLCQELRQADSANYEAAHFLGIIRLQQGRYAEALGFIGPILERDRDGKAWSNYGGALQKLGRHAEALDAYEKSLAIRPDAALTLFNRGVTLFNLNRFEEALASYRAALAIAPEDAESLLNCGIALVQLNRHEDALASFDKALAIHPAYLEALKCRGMALQALRRYGEAIMSFDRALAIDPDFFDVLYSRGYLKWFEFRDFAAALADWERAARLDPDYMYIRGDLLHLRLYGAEWRGFDQETAAIAAGVRAGKRIVNPFAYQAISQSPADLKDCAVTYAAHRYPAMTEPRSFARGGPRKIRIGYVSGEFYAQATAYLMAGLYECHDKSKFEIIGFDNGRDDGSAVRKRLVAAFDKLIDISSLSDSEAAKRIAAEEIDILVNLNGYFGLARMGVFAHRPAPVQVNFLGFPGTLGAPYIDYILADRTVIPPDEQRYYSEKVVYLPDSYQVNDGSRPVLAQVPSRAEAGLPDKGFVFCNFNSSYKLTPATFAVWMNILERVPGSVLWLLESNERFADNRAADDSNARYQANLRAAAAAQGVDGARLVFAPLAATDKYLARMKLADLFLDSLPYNAHTTASDALWADLPLLTCRGTAFPGRVGASLLQAVGLPELVTEDFKSYEALAVRLATDPALLESIRQKLVRNKSSKPLFNTDRYRRHIEQAYAMMWDLLARGAPARSFAVVPVDEI